MTNWQAIRALLLSLAWLGTICVAMANIKSFKCAVMVAVVAGCGVAAIELDMIRRTVGK